MKNEVKIQDNQTIFDIAVQKYGNADDVFKIIALNENIGLEKQLIAGETINYEQTDNHIAKYLNLKNIATDINQIQNNKRTSAQFTNGTFIQFTNGEYLKFTQ